MKQRQTTGPNIACIQNHISYFSSSLFSYCFNPCLCATTPLLTDTCPPSFLSFWCSLPFLELLYNYIQSPQSGWKFSHFYKHVMKSNLSYISRYQPQEKKKEEKKRWCSNKMQKVYFTEIVQSFMILITSELLSFINSSTSYWKYNETFLN